MTNNYLQFSECVGDLTHKEICWLHKVLDKKLSVHALKKLLNFRRQADFRQVDDADLEFFPDFGWQISENESITISLAQGSESRLPKQTLWLYSEANANINHVALLIQAFFRRFRPHAFFSLSWAEYCDKLRPGEFGGGVLVVTVTKIKYTNNGLWLSSQRAEWMRQLRKKGSSSQSVSDPSLPPQAADSNQISGI